MERKSQIYVATLLMCLLAGFAGYINQISNYWLVLFLSLLLAGFTVSCMLGEKKENLKESRFYWLTTFVFTGFEVILTICISLIQIKVTGVFKYINYFIQAAGLLLSIYLIVVYVLKVTNLTTLIKERIETKKEETKVEIEKESVKEETVVNEEKNDDLDDIEIVGENKKEAEVIGIECKKEEIKTPYMEEEI